jgi:hypothetical protein
MSEDYGFRADIPCESDDPGTFQASASSSFPADAVSGPPGGNPRRFSDLPPWPDAPGTPADWAEPQRPALYVNRTVGSQVLACFTDEVSAEWFAHWLSTRDAWEAFSAWLDRKR